MHALLALAPPPAQPGSTQDPRAQSLFFFGMLALMGLMFYFAVIRPQQKRAKDHASLLKGLRPGDKITTTGGIVGVVVTVKEKTVSIRSADAKIEITKAAVGEITERSGQGSED